MASGCGCTEVYRFLHITYPYSCNALFLQQHLYFLFIFKSFSFLFRFFFVIYAIIFSHSINTYERLQASHRSRMKGCT